LVVTEKFDEAWYPGEALNTTVFERCAGGVTHVCLTIHYQSKEARDAAVRSGMEHGMAAGYNRLEELLAGQGSTRTRLERIATPIITETEPQLVAAIHLDVPRSQIRSVVGPALGEIMTAVHGQGIGPNGPWFDHHSRMDPERFDFDVCVPVRTQVSPVGRVSSRELPAERVAQTVYCGPYEGLAGAWKEFDGWIGDNGHEASPDLYQCYVAGPESGSDPTAWRTELRRPLKRKV
jgi:effector-binding domain-containing protein